MKAPEKLYITNDEKRFSDKCHSASTKKYVDDDIEYVRKDVFIEKADEFIDSFFHPDDTELRNCLLKKFHKYMEGE
jgi:hypothetical protein